jgi:hypothetical protein
MPSLPSGRSTLICIALFLLTGAALLRKLFDPDVWFHMTVGREVVRRLAIPGQEFYILPRLGEPGEFHEWGFGVIYYWVEHFAGFAGMAAVNAAFGCGILLFLHLAAAGKSGLPWWQPLPVMALVLLAIEPRLNFRPETLLYLLLAAEIWLLERYLADRKLARLLALPVFSWLLSQCHPSAIFLIGVFGMYALQVLVAAREKIRAAVEMGGVALAMAAASALNPYGLHQLLMPFHTLANDELIRSVNEFLPVLDTVYASYFIAVAAAGAIGVLFAPRRRVVDILLFLTCAVLAFRYARNIALLGIVSYVPISNAFHSWMDRLAKAGARGTIVAALCVLAGLAGIAKAGSSPVWGAGIEDGYTPRENAQLLKQLVPQGNILNFYHLGNYLAWELDRPVFIDGKNYGTNKAVALHDGTFKAERGWQGVIAAYNIQAVITPVTLAISGAIIPLVAELENDGGWILAGRERSCLLFIRNRGQEGVPSLPRETIWRQAIEELSGTVMLYPESREAYRSLSVAYGHLGDEVKQREFYGKYLSLPK